MKLTESTLRKIIKEELSKTINEGHHSKNLNEMNLEDIALNISHFGGFMHGIDVIGSIALSLLATSVIGYIQIRDRINDLNISNEKKQAALKVAQLVDKHKDNEELVELVKNGKLKQFAEKLKELEELEGSSINKTTSANIYKGMKTQLGIRPKSPR